jgi:hypothetical protein
VTRLRILLTLTAALWALAAGTAAASPWTLTNLNLGAEETIYGMNCQPTGFCVGVGQEGVVISSATPTAGAAAWSIGHLELAENLRGNLRGVSCPTASLCVAVDFSGGVWTTTEPAAGAGSWRATKIPKATSIFAISCSASECILVGSGGLIVRSTNPTGGASAWTVSHLATAAPLRSISCTGTLCVAGDFDGGLWTTTNPAGGGAAWTSIGQPAGENPALGVTCQSPTLCLAGVAGYALLSTAPTAGLAAWPATALATRFQILAAACPSATLCVLASNNGEVTASTNPLGGSATYLTEHLIKGVTNALFGLSCPTEALCVAGGKYGQLLTTTTPALTGVPTPAPPLPPETVLLHAPRKTIRIGAHAPAPTVAFRFSASLVPSYFRCQMDKRPGAICTAPRRFRVGAGKHVFRVRGFSAGGGDPTPIVYRFQVIRAKPPKPQPRPKPRKHHPTR